MRGRRYPAGSTQHYRPSTDSQYSGVSAVLLFAGAGDVAPQISVFALSEFKPSYGLGLRFLIDGQENINLRFDYAMGRNEASGFMYRLGKPFNLS